MAGLEHPHVVRLIGACLAEPYMAIVSDHWLMITPNSCMHVCECMVWVTVGRYAVCMAEPYVAIASGCVQYVRRTRPLRVVVCRLCKKKEKLAPPPSLARLSSWPRAVHCTRFCTGRSGWRGGVSATLRGGGRPTRGCRTRRWEVPGDARVFVPPPYPPHMCACARAHTHTHTHTHAHTSSPLHTRFYGC